MPPFADALLAKPYAAAATKNHLLPSVAAAMGADVVTINVGGQVFQTSRRTLSMAGEGSVLSSLSSDSVFFDRDPLLFSPLLALLRTSRLPTGSIDLEDLVHESRFYGLHGLLQAAVAPSADNFDPFSVGPAVSLPLPGRDAPSAIAVSASSALVAHGGKITSFDSSHRHRSTSLTPLPAIDSLLPLSTPSSSSPLAAVGATDFPALHIVDLSRRGALRQTLAWDPHPSSHGSTVQALEASPGLLFASFESCRRNASAIVSYDASTLAPVSEIGRREIFGAEIHSAIPATKLRWIPSLNLLLASGSHAGPSGLIGHVRLWDVRSGGTAKPVFELSEGIDCFADVTASDPLSAVFKVGIRSGELFMADLRTMGGDHQWTCLGDERRAQSSASNGRKEGSGCRVEAHGNHVFCCRGGDVEIWSEVVMEGKIHQGEGGDHKRVMRKNLMGRGRNNSKKITLMAFGGEQMVVARKDEQSVEVWEKRSSITSTITGMRNMTTRC